MIRRALVLLILALLALPAFAQLRLDPLTPQELELAASLAAASPRVRKALGAGRTRQIYIELAPVKSAARHAEVVYYRYEGDDGILVLVDLTARTVAEVKQIDGQSVPISREEVEEAARLALANESVNALLGENRPAFRVATGPATEDLNAPRIEGLRTVTSAPDDPCFGRRCIVLFFRVNNRYEHLNRVVVDLSSRRVQLRPAERENGTVQP